MTDINWSAVARHLKDDAESIRERANAFPNDIDVQREMRSRASILASLANAIWHGLEPR